MRKRECRLELQTAQEFGQALRKLGDPEEAQRRAFVAEVLHCNDPVALFFRNAALDDLRGCFRKVSDIDLRVMSGPHHVGDMTLATLSEDVLKIVDINIHTGLRGHGFGAQAIEILQRTASGARYRRICGELRGDPEIGRRRKFWKSCGFQVDGAGNITLSL